MDKKFSSKEQKLRTPRHATFAFIRVDEMFDASTDPKDYPLDEFDFEEGFDDDDLF